jgi:hypothetical protein
VRLLRDFFPFPCLPLQSKLPSLFAYSPVVKNWFLTSCAVLAIIQRDYTIPLLYFTIKIINLFISPNKTCSHHVLESKHFHEHLFPLPYCAPHLFRQHQLIPVQNFMLAVLSTCQSSFQSFHEKLFYYSDSTKTLYFYIYLSLTWNTVLTLKIIKKKSQLSLKSVHLRNINH